MSSTSEKLMRELITRMQALEVGITMLDTTPSGVKFARMLRYIKFLASDTARALEKMPLALEMRIRQPISTAQSINLHNELLAIASRMNKTVEFSAEADGPACICTYPEHFQAAITTVFSNMENGDSPEHPIRIALHAQEHSTDIEIESDHRAALALTQPPFEAFSLQKEIDLLFLEAELGKLSDTPPDISRKHCIDRIRIKITHLEAE